MRTPAIHLLAILATFASACTSVTATRQIASPTAVRLAPTPHAATPTATTTQPTSCYYVWSTQELPDLSTELDRRLRATNPALSGSAYAYGEDCVTDDGTRTFHAMETDFRIRVQIDDLADRELMGNAIGDAMAVVRELPSSQLQGPQPGRAEFEFNAASSDSLRLIVDIASYGNVAAGLHGADLFGALRSGQ